MATPIFNQFGRPYETPARYTSTEESRYRLDRPRLDGDMASLLSRQKHQMILNDARWIREAFSVVAGAIDQKADYVSASGWLPEFAGRDRAWGKRATEVLHRALDIADVRGSLFDWTDIWWTACCSLDVDGSLFPLLTETETGFPQVQNLEAHRIGSRYSGSSVVPSGPYAGRRIINGIIYDNAAAEIGYRILGHDPSEDRDIPAQDMVHITHPRWFSDGRPFPSIAYSVLDWYDVKESRDLQKQAQKVHAAVTLIESNSTGEAPAIPGMGAGPATRTTNGEPQSQVLMGGLVRYVRSGGGDLKAHESGSPSDGWRSFDRTIERGALFGMGWRQEMLDLSSLTGAGIRGFQDNINTAIMARHRRLVRPALRIARYFVAKLIKRGDLPESSDWWRWAIPQPPEFSVDASRAQQQDRENVRAGFDSHSAVIRRSLGATTETVLRAEAEYVSQRKEIAAEFGLQPDEIGTPLKVGDSVDTVNRLSPSPDPTTLAP
ncbi:hypothetical protein IMCC26134_15100 [Verrucomicrobia bacterium IMCC26134]|nr:hypothetical protein IMCC26134_15100 [Verrucomicrobia bacterium IMCC26134]